jgi:hypothetical protein
MAFVKAMDTALTKQGVKGSDVYTEEGVGDPRVVLFTQLVRDQTQNYIETCVDNILETNNDQMLIDLVVMTFQTRDIRGGKGERDLFYKLIIALHQIKPELTPFLLKLVPEYGCWKDLWTLVINEPSISELIDRLVHDQFMIDQESEHPSLLVKWLPREGSKYDDLAKHFADVLFPLTKGCPRLSVDGLTSKDESPRMRIYRKTLSYLNKKADTAEVKMCANTWSELNPRRIPGRLMKRNKLAFFNQKKGQRGAIEDRYPERDDRVKCKENFELFVTDVKMGKVEMKGATTVMPHEHVHEILHTFQLSKEQEDIIQLQWEAIRKEVLKEGGLNKVVPMCDFSGSMDGVPKEVSLALGILISEVASNDFKDHILTFDSEPRWHSFVGKNTLQEKVKSVGSLGQGLNTDFQKAWNLILERLVEHKVAPEDAPTDLLVLTDMGFDEASRHRELHHYYTGNPYLIRNKPWETQFEMIRSNFEKHGYQAPRIVCWNLRAEYKDFHAKAHEIGIVQLSGWSPSVLKAIQGNGIQVETPYQGMRKILDDVRYDKVRKVMQSLLV